MSLMEKILLLTVPFEENVVMLLLSMIAVEVRNG